MPREREKKRVLISGSKISGFMAEMGNLRRTYGQTDLLVRRALCSDDHSLVEARSI